MTFYEQGMPPVVRDVPGEVDAAPGQVRRLEEALGRLARAADELEKRLEPVLDRYAEDEVVVSESPEPSPGSALLALVANAHRVASQLESLGRRATV